MRSGLTCAALLLVGGCAHPPPVPPAPIATRYAGVAATRQGWALPDTIPDTTARHVIMGEATGDDVPDLAFLITRGDSATIYFLPGAGHGLYGASVEVATTYQLGDDVLFFLDGTLAFGHRSSDDFIAWKWDRRHRRMKLIPEPKEH